jgi:hypothetical protein
MSPTAPSEAACPTRLNTDEAAAYLQQKHGLPVTAKHLRSHRQSARPRGPACRYLGPLALYDCSELDCSPKARPLAPDASRRRLCGYPRVIRMIFPGVTSAQPTDLKNENPPPSFPTAKGGLSKA